MLNDDRIVCPVHLSQFDMKSGEALNLPATDPLLIFEVKIEDSSVLIKI
jgi:nitrite reductase/ring-hydroxylating ferredoxin subunit